MSEHRITALAAARAALEGDSNDAEHDALRGLVDALSSTRGTNEHEHYVPEPWEAADRGICPVDGMPVRWDDPNWIADPDLRVLVLTSAQLSRLDEIVAGADADAVERAALCDLFEEQGGAQDATDWTVQEMRS